MVYGLDFLDCGMLYVLSLDFSDDLAVILPCDNLESTDSKSLLMHSFQLLP